MPSSREDPFLYDCLPCLMPNSFMPFCEPQSLPSLDTEAMHRILTQQAMKNASEDAEQANAILRSISSSCNTEIDGDMTLLCKQKRQLSGVMERAAFQPMSLKENRRPRRDGTGRVSTRRPFTVNLSSFGSNANTERDPNIVQDVDEFWAAAEQREIAEAIAQKMRGEKSPGVHHAETLKTRVRRQGSGRKASFRNFDVKFEDYNTEKYASIDLEKLEEEEYPAPSFTDNEGQAGSISTENGNIEIRKDSVCKESMHDGHEECPCEAVNKNIESEQEPNLDEAVNKNIESEQEPNLDHICQSDLQAHSGETDDLHANAVQQKETSCGFEADETVNMPTKKLLSSCQNSTARAAYLLLQDYLKLDAENMHKAPVSRSEFGFSIGQSYLKGLQCDMLDPLSQSRAESSKAIYSCSFLADIPKDMPMLQPCLKPFPLAAAEMLSENIQQKVAKASSPLTSISHPSSLPVALPWPRKPVSSDQAMLLDANKPSIRSVDKEMGTETPPENVQQKAAEACSPSTSPTPPSNLYAALKRLTKDRSGTQAMLQNTNKSSIRNMDDERANACISSSSLNTNNPSIKDRDEQNVNACTFPPCPSTNKLSIRNMDEEMANACTLSSSPNTNAIDTSSPSKQREDICIRRLSFGSPSDLPMCDGFYNEEGLNDASDMNVFNAQSFTKEGTEEGKVDAVRSNIEIPHDTLLATDKCNPLLNCHTDIVESAVKDVISASAQQVEESPVMLHKKNVKKLKVKEQLNTETAVVQCNLPTEDQIASTELDDKERKKRKQKYQRRQSLAGAGTLWKGGVRRSTRIRSRPLEFWRGERFLYGRIHSSLSTVIGIKYSSPLPTKPKKGHVPQFKVESYVGEQYSDLVEFAALH